MFCYIQEIKLKTQYTKGYSKEIEPIIHTFNGKTTYDYMMSDEKFIRDKNIAYKITLHHSYRVDGIVKKKQWYIATMNYYDIVDHGFWVEDYMTNAKLEEILNETGLEEGTFYNLINEKLDPLVQRITTEYYQTEEYKTHLKHRTIISKYNKRKQEFDDKYGLDTYKECYNVFGELMNEDRLNELKEDYNRKEQEKRSYYEQYQRNYNKQYTSSYITSMHGNYNEEERKLLKEAFKLLAMKYHPDRNPDKNTTEIMATINNLKEKIL